MLDTETKRLSFQGLKSPNLRMSLGTDLSSKRSPGYQTRPSAVCFEEDKAFGMCVMEYRQPRRPGSQKASLCASDYLGDSPEFLVCPLGAGDALIDGLAAGEAFFGTVPVSDGIFAHFPAQQNHLTIHNAGKI